VVGLALLVALAVALVAVPTTGAGVTVAGADAAAVGDVVVRFVGAALLGGPLFVAARAFPRDPVPSLFGVR
jgi:hypothetical protein